MWLKIVLLGQIHIEESKVNADKSQWVFKLANGERVKGWAYLSYTANGQGWTLVNGIYYYLNPTANIQNRPYGSMYQSEQTPDNYRVNENGAWIQ